MRFLTLSLVVAVAIAGAVPTITHGVTGSFRRSGRVNWKGFGYYSRTTQRFVPLVPPTLVGGQAITAGQVSRFFFFFRSFFAVL